MNHKCKRTWSIYVLFLSVFMTTVTSFAQKDCTGRTLGDLRVDFPIPEINTNPYWKTAFADLENGMKSFQKIPSNPELIGLEVSQGAIAVLHPQSTFQDKEKAWLRTKVLLDYVMNNWNEEGELIKVSKVFMMYFETSLAYYMIEKLNPKLLSDKDRNLYRSALQKATKGVMERNGVLWNRNSIEPLVYNIDIRLALGMFITGHSLKNQTYTSTACSFYEMMDRPILPDGGISYIGFSNEVFTYHHTNIHGLAWFHLLTGNQRPIELIKRTRNYYPLSIQRGVAEYYTATSWKHFWNRIDGSQGAYIVASVTGDGENYRIGKNGKHVLYPFFYRKGLKEQPERDNFFVFDRNILGPRARYGNWSFAGSSRDIFNDRKSDAGRGASTFAGAMIFDNGNTTWPLNSAVDKVTVEFQKEKVGRDESERRTKHRSYAQDQVSATSFDGQLSGLTTRYRISDRIYGVSQLPENYKAPAATNWFGNQQWLFTKERIIGQLEIMPNKDEAQYAVLAYIKLVSGRSWWGTERDLIDLGNNTYAFGDMRFKIHNNSFGGKLEYYKTATFESGKKAYNFTIQDRISTTNRDKKVTYKKGQKFSYLVEFYPKWHQPTKEITSDVIANSELRTFRTFDDKRTTTLIHNLSGKQQVLALDQLDLKSKSIKIMQSWNKRTVTVSSTTKTIGIPANHHIILIDEQAKTSPTNNKPPVVAFLKPSGSSVTVSEGSQLNIEVNATDADGTIKSVNLYKNGKLIRTEGGRPYEWGNQSFPDAELKKLAKGKFTLRAEAVDDKGAKSSVELQVIVQPKTATVSGGLIADGDYRIVFAKTKQRLIARALEKHDARMHDPLDFADQQWKFKHLGDNLYTIQNVANQRYLEIPFGKCNSNAGTQVKTWTTATYAHQKWRIKKNKNGFMLMPNHCEASALDVAFGAKNAKVQTYKASTNNPNQQWLLEKIDTGKKQYENRNLTISPVPAHDVIRIQGLDSNRLTIIYDQMGREVLRQDTSDQVNSIDVSSFAPGIYFMQIGLDYKTRFIKE